MTVQTGVAWPGFWTLTRANLVNMDLEWTTLDAQSLRRIHDQAEQDLQRSLLEGADWQHIAEQQRHVIELSIALQKRLEPHFETERRSSYEPGIRAGDR